MTISPKQDLRLFRGSIKDFKLKTIQINIQEEIIQQKPTIQVLQKNNDKPLEIEAPLF